MQIEGAARVFDEGEPAAPASVPARARWVAPAVALAIGAAATALRLGTWTTVFAGGAVRFVPDGDPYYHARRVRMILEQGAIVWRDPWLGYPAGADIPWPPLFDLLIAGAAWVAGLGHPSPHTIDVVAALTPVVLGVAAVGVVAALAAEIFGPAAAAIAGALLAVSTPNVYFSALGRADQHVLELLLFALVGLAYVRGLRQERLRPGPVILLAVAIALSFWNWLGSAITLAVLGASAAIAGILVDPARPAWDRPARLLGWGSAAAAALLLVSIGALGPPGALRAFTLGGLSAFQVVLCALTAALSASLLLGRRRSRLARAALLLGVPAALLALALLAIPALRDPVVHGLTAAGTANAWYGSIVEFMPTLFSGLQPLDEEMKGALAMFGLWPIVATLGLWEAWRILRREPERAGAIAYALVIAVVLIALTEHMKRFMLYGTLPLVLCSVAGLSFLRRKAHAWRPGVGWVAAGLAALVAASPSVRPIVESWLQVMISPEVEAALQRLRPTGAREFRSAVLAPWDVGHHVLFHAERPVIVSPFGTEGGPGAMEDVTAFYTESDPAAAEALLARRGVEYVMLRTPVEEVARLVGHGVRTAGVVHAARSVALDEIPNLIVSRLFFQGGTAAASGPALEGFRLVDEVDHDTEPVRFFELVTGATVRVRGARPGRLLVARAELHAPFGGRGEWATVRTVDERGDAVLRLPYATGANGRMVAGPFQIGDGERVATVPLTEAQVVEGATIDLDLSRR